MECRKNLGHFCGVCWDPGCESKGPRSCFRLCLGQLWLACIAITVPETFNPHLYYSYTVTAQLQAKMADQSFCGSVRAKVTATGSYTCACGGGGNVSGTLSYTLHYDGFTVSGSSSGYTTLQIFGAIKTASCAYVEGTYVNATPDSGLPTAHASTAYYCP